MIVPRPGSDEFAPFYAPYLASFTRDIDPDSEIKAQTFEVARFLSAIDDEKSLYRYAPGKWSIREVVGHLTDGERVFAYRLLRVTRGDQTPLPGFEEDDYVRAARFDRRPLTDLVAEWLSVREATSTLVRATDAEGWSRRGVANGQPISARAIIYVILGHVRHHMGVLRERYGVAVAQSPASSSF